MIIYLVTTQEKCFFETATRAVGRQMWVQQLLVCMMEVKKEPNVFRIRVDIEYNNSLCLFI